MEKPSFPEIHLEDDEVADSRRFHLSQNVRTIIAILVVFLSAIAVWWIMS